MIGENPIDLAADQVDQVALELDAAAALVAMGSRTGSRPENTEAIVLTQAEARGFASILTRLSEQLHQAGDTLRSHALAQAG